MFDDALLESRKTRALGGKRLSLPLAIGLHLAVIGAFVGASVWFTGEPAIPDRPVIIVDLPPGATPPPKGKGETPQNPRPPVARKAEPRIVLPSSGPSLEPGQEPPPEPDDSGETTAPVGPGRPDGVPGAVGPIDGKPGGGGESRVRGEEILPVGGDVHAPILLERVEPDYPEAARRARLEGTLILEAVITAAGTVQEVRVLRSVNPLLDEAAERAVRQWRYLPATLNGRAVPVYLTVTVRFGIAT